MTCDGELKYAICERNISRFRNSNHIGEWAADTNELLVERPVIRMEEDSLYNMLIDWCHTSNCTLSIVTITKLLKSRAREYIL